MVQDRYTQAIERDDHNAASKWALAGAISTDKILVLKGRPTEIVGHMHAHRHDLGAVMDKLSRALWPALAEEPVIHPDPHRVIITHLSGTTDAVLAPSDASSQSVSH